MCRICKRYRCPPNCPSYEGRSAEYGMRIGFCRVCGGEVYEEDRIALGRSSLCLECAEREHSELRKAELKLVKNMG